MGHKMAEMTIEKKYSTKTPQKSTEQHPTSQLPEFKQGNKLMSKN